MTVDEITTKLRSHGLFAIRVEPRTSKLESRGLSLVGDFEDFVSAAKALKQDVVFLANAVFSEDMFNYENDDEVDEPISLSSVMPSLNKFRKYVGKDCSFELWITTPNDTLNFYLPEPWWDEFFELMTEASEKIEEKIENAQADRNARQHAEQRAVIDRLRSLIDDPEFVRLPTQKSMIAYATDKIPELDGIDRATLQVEIQTISAKITAKGLNRKR